MKLTTRRYTAVLFSQTLLLLIDFIINVVLLYARESNSVMLILFIIQDACLILDLSALLAVFFSTHVFQTGLVYLLYERFRNTLLVCMGYFILTTAVNIWLISLRWNNFSHSWTSAFLVMFIIQRFSSSIYYYYYKRAALRISDPRFYEDIDWDQQKLSQTN
ncbi:transmembrane protein 138 [Leptinotarsa decemlineata]|uniref:transmembrane protein 138 n=1 Tax=Leptinotarsa decemlineata TaxID=7539 RepID=UPI000C2530B1|nr:transmembrane protein 138 [Leptinotarsa decemlineata]